jgi:predicted RNase H-like HicB family nuclease
MRKHYVAVIHKEADSDFRALFPDFPGVITIAPTLGEAIKRAGQALALHVKAMFETASPSPSPRA